MKLLNASQYNEFKQGAKALEADTTGEKVLLLHDGTILKLFRLKRLMSSALFIPYSRRFSSHAEKLHELKVPTITMLSVYRIPSINRTAVHYKPLEGETIRKLLPVLTAEERTKLIKPLATFINELHQLGIYFRSLHPGNIVQTPQGNLGLIDISDMKFHKKPLNNLLRLRNFGHFTRGFEEDLRHFSKEDLQNFAQYYSQIVFDKPFETEKMLELFQAD